MMNKAKANETALKIKDLKFSKEIAAKENGELYILKCYRYSYFFKR